MSYPNKTVLCERSPLLGVLGTLGAGADDDDRNGFHMSFSRDSFIQYNLS